MSKLPSWPCARFVWRQNIPRVCQSTAYQCRYAYSTIGDIATRGQSQRSRAPPIRARTRFAPSPTGYLHLGSLRTAIFSYLLAKKTKGQFILRIEDTDRKRTIPDAQSRLCEDLRWAGIHWDEGPDIGGEHEPYNQSQRGVLYSQRASELLASGHAYRCFCTATQPGQASEDTTHDIAAKVSSCRNDCQSLSDHEVSGRVGAGQQSTIRFAYSGAVPAWDDAVYGHITPSQAKSRDQAWNTLQDTILVKSDGSPTYHFANVVDDHEMQITHVIRGTEWMPSTALHVALYQAFGWSTPSFVHVALLTDENGNKLSKRKFDTDIRTFKNKHGLLPSALVNFLVLLGWRNPVKRDSQTLEDLVQLFDLKFSRGNSIVTMDKLWFLQRQHANRIVTEARNSAHGVPELRTLLGYLLEQADSIWEEATDSHELFVRACLNEERELIQSSRSRVARSRDLEAYLCCILYSDPGNYETAEQYVRRNQFYFTTAQACDSKQADRGVAATIVTRLLDDDAVKVALDLWQERPHEATNAMHPIGVAIDHAVGVCTAKLTEILVQVAKGRLESTDLDGDMSEKEVKKTAQYKEVASEVFHLLRERLTFTTEPGPAVMRVMAVVGYEESRRRILGVAPLTCE